MKPPCDPATLRDLCWGGCGRYLHARPQKGESRAACQAGHPVTDADGRCYTCAVRHRGGRGARPTPPPIQQAARRGTPDPRTYCTHDEGEPGCRCAVELRGDKSGVRRP